jgi:hypothetical protein
LASSSVRCLLTCCRFGITLHPTLAYAAMPWLLFAIARCSSQHFSFNSAPAAARSWWPVSNTSFVGLPMIGTFYGAGGVPIGM